MVEKATTMAKGHNSIQLILSDEVLREMDETLFYYGRSLKVNTKRNP